MSVMNRLCLIITGLAALVALGWQMIVLPILAIGSDLTPPPVFGICGLLAIIGVWAAYYIQQV